MKVVLDPAFYNKLKKADVRIRKSVKERILIFAKNPSDLELNNHSLRKPYQGLRSIDITADYRALYKEVRIGKDTVAYFLELGTHDELYRYSREAPC